MTESEAKAILERDLNCLKQNKALPDSIESMELAINALEKQIPKKPILKSGESLVHINKGDKPHEWKLNKWCSWCCPVCGWFVGERYNRVRNDGSIHPHDQRKSNYCNECGQAIDWGNEYE